MATLSSYFCLSKTNSTLVHRGYSRYLRYLLLWNDILILNLSNLLIGFVYYSSFKYFDDPKWLRYFILLNVIWIVIAFINPPYNVLSDRLLKLFPLLRSVTISLIVHGLIIFSLIDIPFKEHGNSFLKIYALTLISVYLSRWLLIVSVKWYRKKGFNYRNVVLFSSEKTNTLLTKYLTDHKSLGYHLKGFFMIDELIHLEEKKSELKEYYNTHEIDEVFINPEGLNEKVMASFIDFCEDEFIKVKLISDIGIELNRKLEANNYNQFWLLEISPLPLDSWQNRYIKRIADIVFSLIIVLVVLSWLFPILWIIIYIESGTPILFKQLRSGKKNQSFNCLKFRTMYANDKADLIQTSENDERVTKVGKFLRKTSLDELPQFINVLKGEMSVVGPRPHMLKHTEDFSQIVERYFQRHHVKPGITGLAQIKGYRGQISSIQDIKGRVNFDKFYVENWSFSLDLKIILQTIRFIFKPHKKAY